MSIQPAAICSRPSYFCHTTSTPAFYHRYWGISTGRDRNKNKSAQPLKCSVSAKPDSDHTDCFISRKKSLYMWYTGLGALGLAETAYLTYIKLAGSTMYCPVDTGSCSDVMSSDYAFVYGVPLPVIGMVAYGLVMCTGFYQLSSWKLPLRLEGSDGHNILLVTITAMAAASSYFLYILFTRFADTPCPYCLVSAFLSLTLFSLSIKDFGWQRIGELVGMQFAVSAVTIALLINSHNNYEPVVNMSSKLLEYCKTYSFW